MTEMNASCYPNPETRPFASFADDMTSEQWTLFHQTQRGLAMAANYDGDSEFLSRGAGLAQRLRTALGDGAYFQDMPVGVSNEWAGRTSIYPAYRDHGNGTCYYGAMSAWMDDGVFHVLEWNRVRGVVVRKYKFMKFLEKLCKTYRLFGGRDDVTSITADDFQPYLDVLFPDLSKMAVEIWDRPSDMYKEGGPLHSCMVGESYVKFYDTAPVKGLVATLNGEMVARALLWTLDDGSRLVGRIYDSTGRAHRLFKDWAAANNATLEIETLTRPQVTAPYSEYGLPYQDDFGVAVRDGNNVVLFYDSGDANRYRRLNPKKIIGENESARCTGGNTNLFREAAVELDGGIWELESRVREFRGKFYSRSRTPYADPYAFHRYALDTVVRGPDGELTLVADLTLLNGEVVYTRSIITVNNVQYAENKVYLCVGLVDGKPAITRHIMRRGDDTSGLALLVAYVSRDWINTHLVQTGIWTGKDIHGLVVEQVNSKELRNYRGE